MSRPARIASVFIASYESPRMAVRVWWADRYFISVQTQTHPFQLESTKNVKFALAVFDALVESEEGKVGPGAHSVGERLDDYNALLTRGAS